MRAYINFSQVRRWLEVSQVISQSPTLLLQSQPPLCLTTWDQMLSYLDAFCLSYIFDKLELEELKEQWESIQHRKTILDRIDSRLYTFTQQLLSVSPLFSHSDAFYNKFHAVSQLYQQQVPKRGGETFSFSCGGDLNNKKSINQSINQSN